MKIRYLETKKSIGRVICHDITKIEKDSFKGPLFKKGHRIREKDVEILLDLGKKHIYALELEQEELHEDEAGIRIAEALHGEGLTLKGPAEGKVELLAQQRGLLKVDVAKLNKINSLTDVVVATLHTNTAVETGEKVAGAKVIPLVVKKEVVEEVESLCVGGAFPLKVLPYGKYKMGGVITGQEVLEGRITDGFSPVLREKASYFAMEGPEILYTGDDRESIKKSILELLSQGCDLIVVTGGMSVDPDDVTPAGIRSTGAHIIKYGAPALPGAMFMLAYKNGIPIVGLPACAMFFHVTVFDLILPRIVAGESITSHDIIALGHGGLCRQCETCFYPRCSFGKGVNQGGI